jgi:hypothetical protein
MPRDNHRVASCPAASLHKDAPIPRTRLSVARWRCQFWADCTINISERKVILMTDSARLNSVPKKMLSVYEKIVGLTDDVCDKHLNSEYRDLARAMSKVLCRKRPSPLTSGQQRTWACGIVYVLGRINFLGDKSITPYMSTADLCAAFEVGESTVHAKARVIEETLGIQPLDPRWTLPSFAEKNPLVWMAEVNGLLVDLRHMPRDLQEIAFAKGLIRYVPADRKDRS